MICSLTFLFWEIGADGDKTTLFLGDNTFCYPNGAMTIGSCRAYLQTSTNLGDVYDDGTITVIDVTLLVDYITGKVNENFIFTNTDVNRDGVISITDVTLLVDYIKGLVDDNFVVSNANGISFSQ